MVIDIDSYILANQDSELIKFILNEIHKCTYFKASTMSTRFCKEILNIKYTDIEESMRRSVSSRIGRIVRELRDLKLIVRHVNSTRGVWKNLYKDTFLSVLNEKMEGEYFIIKLKKGKK